MAKVAAWRARHVYTETFIALDGREAQRLPNLLPQAEIDRFIQSWGVPPER